MTDITSENWVQYEPGGPFYARCPLNGSWVEVQDSRPETEGQAFPIIGHVHFEEATEHWVDTGEVRKNHLSGEEEPVMAKEPRENPIVWDTDVRLLEPVYQAPPEGGTLEISVGDEANTEDKGLV